MIIERPDLQARIEQTRGWLVVYGRRKTGKTFLVREFTPHDDYYFVKRDRSVLTSDLRQVSYEAFTEILPRTLAEGRTVVVDEFHRLGDDLLDRLHAMQRGGRLILISSTLFYAHKLFGERSPLLGLVQEIPVPLIDLKDTLRALSGSRLGKKDRMELAVLLREPITAQTFEPSHGAYEAYRRVLQGTLRTIPALVGEVFTEERRRVTGVYEGIMRAVASGKRISGEIADNLYSRRLIKKNDPSIVQPYLGNLVELGILGRVSVHGKNRQMYKHVSPLFSLFYYADEHYNISERLPSDTELDRILAETLPRIVEDSVRSELARAFSLEETVVESKDHDVDALLVRFKKPEIACEVKWKKKITRKDVNAAQQTLGRYDVKRRVLFVPDKNKVPETDLEVMDPDDLIEGLDMDGGGPDKR